MIISRTSLRISFAGGMTDIPAFYNKTPGAVVSTTIDKYVYVCVMPKFIGKSRIAYRKYEEVDSNKDISHPIIREALKLLKIEDKIEITSIADIPAGTGLGSSSSFTVGLLNALYKYKGYDATPSELAEQACKIEMDILKEPIGKQDQYAAAFGGLNYIKFTEEEVTVEPIHMSQDYLNLLNRNLYLIYLGNINKAKNVLEHQVKQFKDYHFELVRLKVIANMIHNSLKENDLETFGKLLNDAWEIKKLMKGVTNEEINRIYNIATEYGALGGKVCGAGGRGFLMFYFHQPGNPVLMITKHKFKRLDFNIETEGSKIIYVD